jgi:hypothetical protein
MKVIEIEKALKIIKAEIQMRKWVFKYKPEKLKVKVEEMQFLLELLEKEKEILKPKLF